MVKDVLQDNRILYGDWVIFRYDDSFGNSDSLVRVTGRIVGKLTQECAIRTAFESDDYFIMELSKIHRTKLQDPEHPINLFRVRDHFKLEFEWGGRPAHEHICVRGDLLSHWSIPGMSDFKTEGVCPRCGDRGYWKALALNCNWHGQFI
jgi:hypothetical protein